MRRGDDYTPSFSSPFTEGIITNPGDIFLPSQWPEGWRVIFRANDILDNIDYVEDISSTSKNQAIGQAYFLRALYYFYFVNTWDNIPLITIAATSSDDFFPTNSTPDVIYEQIIADAERAKSLLPTGLGDEYGRATWGAATALLGKAYLYTNEWDKAAAEFKEVIDSGLYDLDPDYANNFTEAGDNNIESVFEIQFTPEAELGWSSDQINSSRSPIFLQLRAPQGFGGEWIDQVNPWILDALLSENDLDGEIDRRALATLAWNHPESTIYLNEPFIGSVLNPAKVYAKKYTSMLDGRADDGNWVEGGMNYKLIRYADILLMYAEAANEAGLAESDILTAINEVRARANMPAIPSGQSRAAMRDLIRKERILELSLENDRFFDLKRWGVLVDRMNGNADMVGNIGSSSDQIRAAGHPEENFPFSEIHTRVPIPVAEINSNPNMKQNPGY
jgi:tetratricopeptide (TPR) repeat protein